MNAALQTQAQASPKPSLTPVQTGLLQRKCACGGSSGVTDKCEDCDKKKLSLQRSTEDSEIATRNPELGTRNSEGVPPIVHEVLRSPGRPLDEETRAFMEPRFGHDFSQVRIHTDAQAAESARLFNAFAYTVGKDIVLGAGQPVPSTKGGLGLLAHELTHVVQQTKGLTFKGDSAAPAVIRNASLEREAEIQSSLVVANKPANRLFHREGTPGFRKGPTNVIQLLEGSGGNPPTGGGESTLQQKETKSESSGSDGQPCDRPFKLGGEVTWVGIDQATLDKNVRLVPEEDSPDEKPKVLKRATANSTDTCDAIYFGAAIGRLIVKVPDACTVTVSGTFSNLTWCCNGTAVAIAAVWGKETSPRMGTAQEFGVPNDWRPFEPLKPTEQQKSPVKPGENPGVPKPIKG